MYIYLYDREKGCVFGMSTDSVPLYQHALRSVHLVRSYSVLLYLEGSIALAYSVAPDWSDHLQIYGLIWSYTVRVCHMMEFLHAVAHMLFDSAFCCRSIR